MQISERFKQLRKSLGITQDEFGRRIGIKRNSVALIEGGRPTSDQTIISVCREFGVNEEWLRDGVGEMFQPQGPPGSELDGILEKYNLDRASRIAIEKFLMLDPADREVLLNFLTDVARDIIEESGAAAGSGAEVDETAAAEELYKKSLHSQPPTGYTQLATTGDTGEPGVNIGNG